MRGTYRLQLAAVVLLLAGTAAQAEQAWIVDFRLPQWKAEHFHNEVQADAYIKTVKQLGCEAKKVAHNGHTDVQVRCINWKRMMLATDKQAHDWIRWLGKRGFQTHHEH